MGRLEPFGPSPPLPHAVLVGCWLTIRQSGRTSIFVSIAEIGFTVSQRRTRGASCGKACGSNSRRTMLATVRDLWLVTERITGEDCAWNASDNQLKVGLFGIGLDTYWPQFPGLRDHSNRVHRASRS